MQILTSTCVTALLRWRNSATWHGFPWRYRLISIFLLLGLVITSFWVDGLAHFSEEEVCYRQEALELGTSAAPTDKPVIFPTSVHRANRFTIDLQCLATDDHFVDFFQTSDNDQALRLELQHPSRLYLALGEVQCAPLNTTFHLNQ